MKFDDIEELGGSVFSAPNTEKIVESLGLQEAIKRGALVHKEKSEDKCINMFSCDEKVDLAYLMAFKAYSNPFPGTSMKLCQESFIWLKDHFLEVMNNNESN